MLLCGPESAIFAKDFGKIDKFMVLKEFRESADPDYPELVADTFKYAFRYVGVTGENIKIGLGSYVECTLPIVDGLRDNFPHAEIIRCNDIMVKLRSIKSENALACIREGFRIIELATDEVIKVLKPGVTELQMVGVVQRVIYENGAEYEGLPMYVFLYVCIMLTKTRFIVRRCGTRSVRTKKGKITVLVPHMDLCIRI